MKLNNKGFTLVEVLAVVVILGIISGVAITGVLSSINASKESAYKLMVNHIVTASQTMYEEIDFGTKICNYNQNGPTGTCYDSIAGNSLTNNLQTLISNGYLTGEENKCLEDENSKDCDNKDNKNNRVIKNPKTKKDIGTCKITITKDTTTKEYSFTENNSNQDCPTTEDYNKYKKGVKE